MRLNTTKEVWIARFNRLGHCAGLFLRIIFGTTFMLVRACSPSRTWMRDRGRAVLSRRGTHLAGGGRVHTDHDESIGTYGHTVEVTCYFRGWQHGGDRQRAICSGLRSEACSASAG